MNLELSSQLSEHVEKFTVPPERVNSQIEVLKSTELLSQLVAALGLANSPEERVSEIGDLQRRIEVRAIPLSTIIEINFTDTDPAFATRIVGTLVDLYAQYYHTAFQGENMAGFYQAEINEANERLKNDFARFNELRTRVGLEADLATDLKVLQESLTELRRQQSENDIKYNEVAATRAALEEQLKKQPKQIESTSESIPNPDALALRQHITTLGIQKNALLTKYTDDARESKDLDEELKKSKDKLAQLPTMIEGKSIKSPNPVYGELEKQLISARVQMQGLKSNSETLLAEIKSKESRLTKLYEHTHEITAMENALAANKKTHTNYLSKLDDANFIDSLNDKKINNISVIQSPSTPMPVKRPLATSLALALGLGAVMAAAVAYLIESLRPTLETGEQLKEMLNLPLLASISRREI
jgi:uncharacterized protein involved in exopolysaccharide biosynthesis